MELKVTFDLPSAPFLVLINTTPLAAIYGSRAANGVVLISTKNGADGKSKVTFSAQYGVSDVVSDFDALNVEQYKELQDEIGIVNLPEGLKDVTDWQDSLSNRHFSELSSWLFRWQ